MLGESEFDTQHQQEVVLSSTASRYILGPSSLILNGYVSIPGIAVEVKIVWIHNFTPSARLHGVMLN
jgi:hypothetical protein